MYFPLSQITTNLDTNGEDYYVASTNQPYSGKYFKTSKGTSYTGATPKDGPNLLIVLGQPENTTNQQDTEEGNPGSYNSSANATFLPLAYVNSNSNTVSPTIPLITSTPLPTQEDYNNVKYQRYFLKRATNYIYKEVSEKTYNLYKNQSPEVQYSLYVPLKINWIIRGELLNVYRTNINIVKRAERINGWVGFFDSFKDRFARYFKNEDNKVFYTSGGELKIKDTDIEYIGYYHVHPSKGVIMEGRVHVDTPHNILVLIEEGDILTKQKVSTEGEVGTSRRRNIPRGLY